MRHLFTQLGMMLILLFALSLHAQNDPPPCSAESEILTSCSPAGGTECQQCYERICADTDVIYSTTCDQYCDNPYPICSTNVSVQVTPGKCALDPASCPDPANPYACDSTTITSDICTGQTCSTGIQILCEPTPIYAGAMGPRKMITRRNLDQFGPRIASPKVSPIPAGILLKRRYQILLSQARPGAKCAYTKKFRKYWRHAA